MFWFLLLIVGGVWWWWRNRRAADELDVMEVTRPAQRHVEPYQPPQTPPPAPRPVPVVVPQAVPVEQPQRGRFSPEFYERLAQIEPDGTPGTWAAIQQEDADRQAGRLPSQKRPDPLTDIWNPNSIWWADEQEGKK